MHNFMRWNRLNACNAYKCDGSLGGHLLAHKLVRVIGHLLGEQKLGFIQQNLGKNVGRWPQLTAVNCVNWDTGNPAEPHSWMSGVIFALDVHWATLDGC